MTPTPLRSLAFTTALLLAAGSALPAAESKPGAAAAAEAKKINDRYALTRSRINALIGQRLHPTPLPASLPNPFYHTPPELAADANASPGNNPTDVAPVPAAPDSSDIDTLMKYANALKISGVMTLNDRPLLTINQTLCKEGDVVPVGSKDHPVYLQVQHITSQEVTFRLNDATYAVRLKH